MPSNEVVAWFFMADGSANFNVCRCNQVKLGFRIDPRGQFSNCDLEIIDEISNWCFENGIKYSIGDHTGKNSQKPNFRYKKGGDMRCF